MKFKIGDTVSLMGKEWLPNYVGKVGIIIFEDSKNVYYPLVIKLLDGNTVYGSELSFQHSKPLSKLEKLVLGYYEI